jgi:hypothetical protein
VIDARKMTRYLSWYSSPATIRRMAHGFVDPEGTEAALRRTVGKRLIQHSSLDGSLRA